MVCSVYRLTDVAELLMEWGVDADLEARFEGSPKKLARKKGLDKSSTVFEKFDLEMADKGYYVDENI